MNKQIQAWILTKDGWNSVGFFNSRVLAETAIQDLRSEHPELFVDPKNINHRFVLVDVLC